MPGTSLAVRGWTSGWTRSRSTRLWPWWRSRGRVLARSRGRVLRGQRLLRPTRADRGCGSPVEAAGPARPATPADLGSWGHARAAPVPPARQAQVPATGSRSCHRRGPARCLPPAVRAGPAAAARRLRSGTGGVPDDPAARRDAAGPRRRPPRRVRRPGDRARCSRDRRRRPDHGAAAPRPGLRGPTRSRSSATATTPTC